MSDDRTIVVVDDSPTIRETISFILEMEGFEVETAVNGVEGLELIRRRRPKAVLLDGMMPEMDGFEVSRQVRADPDLKAVTLIMLTAMGQKVDEERARDAGVDHFLTKPFDHDEALDLLGGIYGDGGGA
jgi:CheY-like chemotaxis protein